MTGGQLQHGIQPDEAEPEPPHGLHALRQGRERPLPPRPQHPRHQGTLLFLLLPYLEAHPHHPHPRPHHHHHPHHQHHLYPGFLQTYGRTSSARTFASRCTSESGSFSLYDFIEAQKEEEKPIATRSVAYSFNEDRPEDQTLKAFVTFAPFRFGTTHSTDFFVGWEGKEGLAGRRRRPG